LKNFKFDREILTVTDLDYGIGHRITHDGGRYVWTSSLYIFGKLSDHSILTGFGDKSELAMTLGFNEADLTLLEMTFERLGHVQL
jgi:hypothetical protein